MADFSTGVLPVFEKEVLLLPKQILEPRFSIQMNHKGSELGIVLTMPSGKVVRQSIKCHFITSNEVKYKVVVAGMS